MNEDLVKLVKEYRRDVDVLINISNPRVIGMFSTNINNCLSALKLGKGWLGKILGELGSQNPYEHKDGKRKTVDDIVPTADTSSDEEKVKRFKEMKPIESIDTLRQEIQAIIDKPEDFSQRANGIDLEQGFVYKYLCEARMWLGFELQRLKEDV